MAQAYLGIDIGTSATKVLALAEDGTVLAKAKRSYATHSAATNWAEQSPGDWWTAVAQSSRDVIGALGGTPVVAIGLSGQLNGIVLADARGEPLQDAIIWLDLRATEEARQLQADLGGEIERVSGNRISPISVMAKLLWLNGQRPELLARTRRVFLVKDYILWRLTGAHATDRSDASATNLMDLSSGRWSADLCRAAGIDPDMLPPILLSTAIAGHVREDSAAETGLKAGTPVVAGGGDVAALATGCGVLAEGVLGVTLGTAGHVVAASREPVPGGTKGLWQIAHVADGLTIWLGLIMAGGLSLSWLHRTMAMDRDSPSFEEFAALAGRAEPGARGLTFLPFLEGAATPHDRPDARAAFIGLTSSHAAPDMVQAVLEGVAYNLRECVEVISGAGAAVNEIRLAEGGSRVARWCQIISDVLRRPVGVLEEQDTSALGAAMAAQCGVSGSALGDIALSTVRVGRRFSPQRPEDYEDGYLRYRSLVRRLYP